jgi:CRP-like cAMP-binding protein
MMPLTKSAVRRPAGTETERPKNRLLACLPPEDFERIRPHLTTVPVKTRHVFHRRGDQLREVYFPNGGVASVTATMLDGNMVEVATIGDEGMVGVGAFFGADRSAGESMMQVPDTDAEMMPVAAFVAEIDRRGALHDCVSRYSHALMSLMMQSTACMALHPLQDRCCRWLLMTHDRVRRDEFELSHEFLATMLGSSRPTVSLVAGTLQQAGLIRYRHGHMTIVDREALEAAACECYATVRSTFEQLGLYAGPRM